MKEKVGKTHNVVDEVIAPFSPASTVGMQQTRSEKQIEMLETRRFLYAITMPLFWMLTVWVFFKKKVLGWFGKQPRTNALLFDGLGSGCRAIRLGAATWRALDVIYNFTPRAVYGVGDVVDNFWIGMMNAQAVRNRLKLAKQEVAEAIRAFASAHSEVRILSLAAGSAQGVIEVLADFKHEGIFVRTLLVDIDPSALEYATRFAQGYEVADRVEIRTASAAFVSRLASSFQPHIIEMMGLLDYVEQHKAPKFLEKIRRALPEGGIFLTCNIHANREQKFLKQVIDWDMVYRTPGELASLLEQTGFKKVRLVTETHGIHSIAVGHT